MYDCIAYVMMMLSSSPEFIDSESVDWKFLHDHREETVRVLVEAGLITNYDYVLRLRRDWDGSQYSLVLNKDGDCIEETPWKDDFKSLSAKWHEMRKFPSIENSNWIPDLNCLISVMDFNYMVRRKIDAEIAMYPFRLGDLTLASDIVNENLKIIKIMINLKHSSTMYDGRACLQAIKDILGEYNFNNGIIPNLVPREFFRDTDE